LTNNAGHTMSLGRLSLLTEVCITDVFWGKGGLHAQIAWKFWEPEPPGALRACQVCKGIALLITFTFITFNPTRFPQILQDN